MLKIKKLKPNNLKLSKKKKSKANAHLNQKSLQSLKKSKT
jgi:hypothetical protein